MEILRITFASQLALDHFATWLCDNGEQSYWDSMEYVESDEEGDVTAVDFKYHMDGVFIKENLIETKCGRLDRNE